MFHLLRRNDCNEREVPGAVSTQVPTKFTYIIAGMRIRFGQKKPGPSGALYFKRRYIFKRLSNEYFK